MEASSRFSVGALTFTCKSSDLDKILSEAYQYRQRPVCLCSGSQPEMYIARFGDHYILKRMPGTGHLHDPSCPTFDPPPELSGLGHINDSAITVDEQGLTSIKLGFPLSIRGTSNRARLDTDSLPTSATDPVKRLTLKAVLHYLWDAADLTKWRPGMAGKRNWYIVRRELLSAATSIEAKSIGLSKILYIPETYHSDKDKQITANRRRFMHQLMPVKGKPTQLGIVIGEFKQYVPSQYGRALVIKHSPGYNFFMDERLVARFEKLTGDHFEMLASCRNCHLIVFATFYLSQHGYAHINEITAMPVTEQWLPFDNPRELELIEALLNRSFSKCMKYNLNDTAPVASALLVDSETPTALYCPPPGLAPDDEDELRTVAQSGVYPFWIWSATDFEMPALPAVRLKSSELTKIQKDSHGQSTNFSSC